VLLNGTGYKKPALTLVLTMIKTFLKKPKRILEKFYQFHHPKKKIKNSLELALLQHTKKISHP
jgi:hypothetical protein